jgi:hypothetical protein
MGEPLILLTTLQRKPEIAILTRPTGPILALFPHLPRLFLWAKRFVNCPNNTSAW